MKNLILGTPYNKARVYGKATEKFDGGGISEKYYTLAYINEKDQTMYLQHGNDWVHGFENAEFYPLPSLIDKAVKKKLTNCFIVDENDDTIITKDELNEVIDKYRQTFTLIRFSGNDVEEAEEVLSNDGLKCNIVGGEFLECYTDDIIRVDTILSDNDITHSITTDEKISDDFNPYEVAEQFSENSEFTPEYTVIFHIGRGGRFNNGGYLRAKDIKREFDGEYYGLNINFVDEEGNALEDISDIPEDEIYIQAGNHNTETTLEEYNSLNACLNIDNEYDSYCWKTIDNLDEKDIEVLVRDLGTYEYEEFVNEALRYYNPDEWWKIWEYAEENPDKEVMEYVINFYRSVTLKELENRFE